MESCFLEGLRLSIVNEILFMPVAPNNKKTPKVVQDISYKILLCPVDGGEAS